MQSKPQVARLFIAIDGVMALPNRFSYFSNVVGMISALVLIEDHVRL
jgi:hypothetical protein